MSEKIVKFPISFSQHRRNKLGALNVECQVSGRMLSFHEESAILGGGEFITVDVKTMFIEDEEQRKICQLIVTREDLLKALNYVHPKQDVTDD